MKIPKTWHIFPLKPKSKEPFHKNWTKVATNDRAKIRAWMKNKKYAGCNWAMLPAKSGLVAIDVDRKGLEHWKSLCIKNGEPQTLKIKSGARGGFHYVFEKGKSGQKLRGLLSHGIEIRVNGYIVIPPSRITKAYKAMNALAPAPLPEWLLEQCVRPKRSASKKGREFDPEFFKPIIEQLREKEFGYAEWLSFGMALHEATNGSLEGLDLFTHLSEGVSYKPGDEALCAYKWESFDSSRDDAVTMGTFMQQAKDLGCRLPAKKDAPEEYFADESKALPGTPESEAYEMPQSIRERLKAELDLKLWSKNKLGRHLCECPKELVKRINLEGYALLTGPGKAGRIIKVNTDQWGVKTFTELSNQQFKNSTAHLAYKSVFLSADGEAPSMSYREASSVWLESELKKQYSDIAFRPRAPKGALNLWGRPPIPCESAGPQGLELLDKYFLNIIASGCPKKYHYVLQWLAHLVQHPEDKPNVVLVIKGIEGTGKGFLTNGLLRGILKSRFLLVDSRPQLKSRFTGNFAFKFLITLDEACWQGDNELQGILRSRTGNNTLQVEEKFGSAYTVEDYARFIITTNRDDSVMLQASNRRYLILENPERFANHKIFTRLWDEVKHGDLCERFYTKLLRYDLEGFNPNRFPKELDTQGTATKVDSDLFRSYLYDLFYENPRPLWRESDKLVKRDLFEDFADYVKMINGSYKKQLTQSRVTRELRDICPALRGCEAVLKTKGEAVRGYRVSPKEVCESFRTKLRIGENPLNFEEKEFVQGL